MISGATVYNQDDCLAVNSGTDITFTGGYCSGGHGLSIGSVGGRSDNVVDTVKILDSQIVNSDNGVRIKTVSGATGKVSGVTYSNIKLSNVSFLLISSLTDCDFSFILTSCLPDRQVRHCHPAGLREWFPHWKSDRWCSNHWFDGQGRYWQRYFQSRSGLHPVRQRRLL